MHSRKQSPVEAVVIQLAVVMEVEGVSEADTTHDPKVDIVNNPLTDEVNVPIVEHPTNQGNAQPMVKPAITAVRVVIMPDTAIQHSAHPLQERYSCRDIHDMEQAENFEYDTIQVVRKVTFGPNCYKDCSAYSGNVMFDEIASVKKHNL